MNDTNRFKFDSKDIFLQMLNQNNGIVLQIKKYFKLNDLSDFQTLK